MDWTSIEGRLPLNKTRIFQDVRFYFSNDDVPSDKHADNNYGKAMAGEPRSWALVSTVFGSDLLAELLFGVGSDLGGLQGGVCFWEDSQLSRWLDIVL